MTPHYIAVGSDWTAQQVLDHVRQHGQNSETLSVIYVVDRAGKLIDDIHIREFLLTPSDKLVSGLMAYRYVALRPPTPKRTPLRSSRPRIANRCR
jgi:magnesium transporter